MKITHRHESGPALPGSLRRAGDPGVRRRADRARRADQGPGQADRGPSSPSTPTRTSSAACPAPPRCAPLGSSPRSATAAAGSPPPKPSPPWPGSPPQPGSPGRSAPPRSAGRPTDSGATRSATSPPTPATPTSGPRTSITRPSPAGTATHTPCCADPRPRLVAGHLALPAGPPALPTRPAPRLQLLLTALPPQPGLGSSRGSPSEAGSGQRPAPGGSRPARAGARNPSTGTPAAG